MKTTSSNSGLKVKASIKAGGIGPAITTAPASRFRTEHQGRRLRPGNHNRAGLKVTTGIKAGEPAGEITTLGLKVALVSGRIR